VGNNPIPHKHLDLGYILAYENAPELVKFSKHGHNMERWEGKTSSQLTIVTIEVESYPVGNFQDSIYKY